MLYKNVLFALIKKGIKHGSLVFYYENKKYVFGSEAYPQGVITVLNPNFFSRVVRQGEVGLGEAYLACEWESPNILDVLLVIALNSKNLTSSSSLNLLVSIRELCQSLFFMHKELSCDKKDSAEGMRKSYDVGNHFFRQMLGEKMQYTCAIFKEKSQSLDEAQQHKLDIILKKLSLSANQKVLDIGCGWGGLLKEIHEKHQCVVTGISLSREQIDYCKKTHPFGEFRYIDYRDLEGEGVYDRIVSVGMAEHVGKKYFPTYMNTISKLLKPEGKALIHTMIKGTVYPDSGSYPSFGAKYIMPSAYVPYEAEIIDAILGAKQLRIIHQERFGIHYAKTAQAWRQNVLDHDKELNELYDYPIVRMYDYIWAGLSAAFNSRMLDLTQILVEKSSVSSDLNAYDPRVN